MGSADGGERGAAALLRVQRLAKLPTEAMTAGSTGEVLGRVAVLAGALEHLRVHYERLDPGHRSSRPHFHSHREECVYVIAGAVVLELDGQPVAMAAGDFAAIPAGPPLHVVCNRGEQAAELLVFSASPQPDDVTYEPHSSDSQRKGER